MKIRWDDDWLYVGAEMEETDSQPARRLQQKVIPHSILNASLADLFSSKEILIGMGSMFVVLTWTEFHVKWSR